MNVNHDNRPRNDRGMRVDPEDGKANAPHCKLASWGSFFVQFPRTFTVERECHFRESKGFCNAEAKIEAIGYVTIFGTRAVGPETRKVNATDKKLASSRTSFTVLSKKRVMS